jgi:hypothetical protein
MIYIEESYDLREMPKLFIPAVDYTWPFNEKIYYAHGYVFTSDDAGIMHDKRVPVAVTKDRSN